MNYCITNYTSTKPLYIAGGLADDAEKSTLIINGDVKEAVSYRASHEEADDRMMYTIQQLYIKTSQTGRITVVTPDADIFVVFLYHLKNTWHGKVLECIF